MPTDDTRIPDAEDHMPKRTILDEIQEALERACDPKSATQVWYAAQLESRELLWKHKEPLLAVARAAAEVAWWRSGEHDCDQYRSGDGDCSFCKMLAKLRNLDPRLLGES